MANDLTTPSLDALLKIAEALADDSDDDNWQAFIDAFNPTLNKALVRVAMAAEKWSEHKVSTAAYHIAAIDLRDALLTLTTALKGSDHGQ